MANSLPTRSPFLFPRAQQAQIIRANQRDLYHVSSLKDHTESVLRAWLGTRWLTRWDKELDLAVKLCYYGLTTGRAIQTLGEEYTDIWQYSSSQNTTPLSPPMRIALILASLIPSYVMGRWGHSLALNNRHPTVAKWFRILPTAAGIATEVNLAAFYFRGIYYDLIKRLIGVQHISSIPEDPHTRPPSYSLLGILISVRLLYRLLSFFRARNLEKNATSGGGKERNGNSASPEIYLDGRPVSSLLYQILDSEPVRQAEDDERTALDIQAIPDDQRASRNCTLCLEERTESCATECGHLFCWSCIIGWGREKAECPLCRQSLSLDRLLPIYNL